MDKQFLERALELAQEHSADGLHGPFGAIIVKDGNIIGEGWNQVVETNDPTAHAEVVALRAASQHENNFDLSGATVYASCEPCPMCFAASYWAKVSRVVYAASKEDAAAIGFDDDFIYKEINLPHEDRSIEFAQELHEQGKGLLEKWAANPNKKMY